MTGTIGIQLVGASAGLLLYITALVLTAVNAAHLGGYWTSVCEVGAGVAEDAVGLTATLVGVAVALVVAQVFSDRSGEIARRSAFAVILAHLLAGTAVAAAVLAVCGVGCGSGPHIWSVIVSAGVVLGLAEWLAREWFGSRRALRRTAKAAAAKNSRTIIRYRDAGVGRHRRGDVLRYAGSLAAVAAAFGVAAAFWWTCAPVTVGNVITAVMWIGCFAVGATLVAMLNAALTTNPASTNSDLAAALLLSGLFASSMLAVAGGVIATAPSDWVGYGWAALVGAALPLSAMFIPRRWGRWSLRGRCAARALRSARIARLDALRDFYTLRRRRGGWQRLR